MYLIDFVKRIVRQSNVPIIIYLVLNIFIIGFALMFMFELEFITAFVIGIILYSISMAIALSPIGEWVLRFQNGCKKITRQDQLNYIMPLFAEVYSQAKEKDSTIPDDVKLFIANDSTPNAFATGRKTICITEGLLQVPDNQIKATLAHEFGHLSNKDTDLILVITIGNAIVTILMVIIRLIVAFINLIMGIFGLFLGGSEGFITTITSVVSGFLMDVFIVGGMWLWTKIGTLFIMKSSREHEYDADKFALELGYGNELCALLDNIDNTHTTGLFAQLAGSHPDKNDRINKLQELGATYRQGYAN